MSYDQNIVTDTLNSSYWFLNANGKSYAIGSTSNTTGTGTSGKLTFTQDVKHQITRNEGTRGFRILTEAQNLEEYDSQGRLRSITAPTSVRTSLTYQENSRLVSEVKDSLGRSLSFDYENVRLQYKNLTESSTSSSSGSSGSMIGTFERPIKRLQSVTSNTHGTIRYGYDDNNNLTQVTYPDGSKKTYHYEDQKNPHALTGITDEAGIRLMTYAYDDQGRAVSEHSPAVSGVNHYQLSFSGNTTTVTDPLGTVRAYQFTTVNDIKKSTGQNQPGGSGCGPATLNNQYDAHGNLTRSTDFKGNVTTYTYDPERNLETQRTEGVGTPAQRTITTTWHPYWRMPVQIAEPHKITTYLYNGDTQAGTTQNCSTTKMMDLSGTLFRPSGVLCKKTEQATTDTNGSQGINATTEGTPRTWTYTYNAFGQITSLDGPRTDVSDKATYTYHSASDTNPGKRSQLYTLTNALGQKTSLDDYDTRGNPIQITDANNIVTTLEYDTRNRLTRSSTDGDITDYQYTATGELDRLTLPDGHQLYYTYDPAHRLTDITDKQGNRLHYTLDAMGNRIQEDITDPQGTLSRTHRRAYDPLNRLYQEIGAGNQTTTYEYDANGNPTQITDPLKQRTTYGYDALNRLIQMIDPHQGKTQLAWNGQNQLTQITDPRALKTTYTLDGLGNPTQLNSPDTGKTTHTYDSAGNLTSKTDAKGQKTTYQYDALNRPLLITYQDGKQHKYTWDQNSNGKGHLSKLEELNGSSAYATLEYTYDAQGKILTQKRQLKNTRNAWISHTQSYTYQNGRLSHMTLPSTRQLTYAYNTLGQISQITLTNIGERAGEESLIASDITYHPFGNIQSWKDNGGQRHQKPIDQDGRTRRYTLGNTTWQLTYDEASRIIAQMDTQDAAKSVSYRYDKQDRLTGAQLPNVSYSYTYDATGNRTSQLMGSVSQTHLIDPNSNRLTATTGNQPKNYTYDLTGNLTSDGQINSTYDARGRLIQVETAAGATTYQINALGQRIRKTDSIKTTWYHYDPSGKLLAESDDTGKITREYLWLGDTLIAIVQ